MRHIDQSVRTAMFCLISDENQVEQFQQRIKQTHFSSKTVQISQPQAQRLFYQHYGSADYDKLIKQFSIRTITVLRFDASNAQSLPHSSFTYIITDPKQSQIANEIFGHHRTRRCIAVIGPPACGKGSQCERLKSAYQIIHISTGELLRHHVQQNTEIGIQVAGYMKRGELVPNSTIVDLTLERCHQQDCETHGFILDGFPRNILQAERLLADQSIVIDAVIHYTVREDELIKRSTGRRVDPITKRIYHISYNPPSDPVVSARLVTRVDDTLPVVKARLFQFQQTSAPILDVFVKHSVPVLHIDASSTDIDQIFHQTVVALEQLKSQHKSHLIAKL